MIGFLDELEWLFGDPTTAWEAITEAIEDRKALREARKSSGPACPTDETGPAEPIHRGPRPSVGFDRERATYERIKPALLESAEGKWVVIVGEEVIGPFDDLSNAMRAGYKRFGPGPLFLKEVLAQEPPPLVLPPYLDISCPT